MNDHPKTVTYIMGYSLEESLAFVQRIEKDQLIQPIIYKKSPSTIIKRFCNFCEKKRIAPLPDREVYLLNQYATVENLEDLNEFYREQNIINRNIIRIYIPVETTTIYYHLIWNDLCEKQNSLEPSRYLNKSYVVISRV